MCHRLCGLSTNGLKAHVREISTPLKLTIRHGHPLPFLVKQQRVRKDESGDNDDDILPCEKRQE